jgi:hypothetical protein
MARASCVLLGHRWEAASGGSDTEYGAHPIFHCARCNRQKAFPVSKALDPEWRLGRLGRLRFLAKEGARWIFFVVLVALAIAGVTALLALASGQHGTHQAKVVVVALAVVGGLCVLAASLADPMGIGSVGLGAGLSGSRQSRGLDYAHFRRFGAGRLMRIDNLAFGVGAVLIAMAVLIHILAR